MDKIAQQLKAYIETHTFDPGDSDCETVLDQLYKAYAESHESDPPENSEGFKELEEFLCSLPLEDNNAVFDLCCRLCSAYERKAFAELYGILIKHDGFVRVGSAYIVNLRNIKNVSNSEVYMYNNIIIPIPRGKHIEIKKAFWDYQYEGQED